MRQANHKDLNKKDFSKKNISSLVKEGGEQSEFVAYKNRLHSFHNKYCEKTSTEYQPKEEVRLEKRVAQTNKENPFIKYLIGKKLKVNRDRAGYVTFTEIKTKLYYTFPPTILNNCKKQFQSVLSTKDFKKTYY